MAWLGLALGLMREPLIAGLDRLGTDREQAFERAERVARIRCPLCVAGRSRFLRRATAKDIAEALGTNQRAARFEGAGSRSAGPAWGGATNSASGRPSKARQPSLGLPGLHWLCDVPIYPWGVSRRSIPQWPLPQPAAEPTIGPPTLFAPRMAAVSDLLNATGLACPGLQRFIHASHWCSICDKDAEAKRGDERRNHQQLPHNAVLLFLSPAAAP